jgi:hypothetical protein
MVLLLEVIGYTLLEVSGFANIDDSVLVVSEQIATGIVGKGVK